MQIYLSRMSPAWHWLQRVANMARSRSLAVCFLIICIFFLLLICLDNTNAAMGYDLLCVPCMSMQRTPFASLIKRLKIQINFQE
jgi:hypothetical protein